MIYSPCALRDEEGLCVSMGWMHNECTELDVRTSILREIESSSVWMLGVNRTFPVRMMVHAGTIGGPAFSIVLVYFKGKDGKYDQITDFSLQAEDDIFAVVERLDEYFGSEQANPDIAKIWKSEMATLDQTLAAYANLRFDMKAFTGDIDKAADDEPATLPPWLDEVISKMRFKEIDRSSSLRDLTAYVRFYKSWDAWMSVNGKLVGRICEEADERNDSLVRTIDSYIPGEWEDAACAPYVALLYQLLPALIDHFNGDDSHDIDFVKSTGRWAVDNIADKVCPLSFEIANLFFDVRKEASRLPKAVTPYMKKQIPALITALSEESERSDKSGPSDDRQIQLLTLRTRWSNFNKSKAKGERQKLYSELISLSEKPGLLQNPDSAYAISRLFLEYLSDQALEKDKENFYSKIRETIIDGLLSASLSDADLFNLSAPYLEYKFTQYGHVEGRDICTFFRNDYECLMAQIKEEKKGGLPGYSYNIFDWL